MFRIVLLLLLGMYAGQALAVAPSCKQLFLLKKPQSKRFTWNEALAKRVMALLVERNIFTEGSYFRQDPQGKIAQIIKEVTDHDLKSEGLYFWTRRHVGKWEQWLAVNQIVTAKWDEPSAQKVILEVKRRRLPTAGISFKRNPKEILATIIFEVTGHELSPRSLYEWVSAEKGSWNKWLTELGLETKNSWRWQEPQAKEVMKELAKSKMEFGSRNFITDREGLVAKAIYKITGHQTTARGLYEWAHRHYSWESWLALNQISYKRNIWTVEEATEVLFRLREERLSLSSQKEGVRQKVVDIIVSVTGQKRNPQSLYHWARANYGSWKNWLEVNDVPATERGWSEQQAKQVMQQLKAMNFPKLNASYFQRDPDGKIASTIEKVLNQSYSAKSLALWVYKNPSYESWAKWLEINEIDASKHTLHWTEAKADLVTKQLIKEEVPLNYVSIYRDVDGAVKKIIAEATGNNFQGKSFINWVRVNYGSWDRWLVKYNINPDAVRLLGFAEYSILTTAMQRSRKERESYRQAMEHDVIYLVDKEKGSRDIEVIDPYRLEDDVFNRQVEKKFSGVVAEMKAEQANVVKVLLEFVQQFPDQASNIYGKEFRIFYREETDKELDSDIFQEALRALASNPQLAELLL